MRIKDNKITEMDLREYNKNVRREKKWETIIIAIILILIVLFIINII